MTAAGARIDRQTLVERHAIVQRGLDPRSPLSVGNGEFSLTADLTGLQTFPAEYPVAAREEAAPDGTLLGTFHQRIWHSIPANPEPRLADVLVDSQTPRGPVGYPDMSGGQAQYAQNRWLRGNPHRLHLGLLGFAEATGPGGVAQLDLDDVTGPEQRLDLWRSALTSDFVWRGIPVRVRTACDPDAARFAVVVDSAALRHGLVLRMRFPYGSELWHDGADWGRQRAHTTTLRTIASGAWRIERRLDATSYAVQIAGPDGAEVECIGPHELVIRVPGDHAAFVVEFVEAHVAADRQDDTEPAGHADHAAERSAATVIERAERASVGFWRSGAAIDLSAVDDARASELERRIVLSQYVTRINCSGSLPPAETGLVCNSWSGKFHLEMHWWHAAHFPMWGRPDLLRRSLGWYREIMPSAQDTAKRQRAAGARWPKHVGPDGRESPSPVGPFLIWQQPHPIALAELIYRADPSDETLAEYADVVSETAAFMAGATHEEAGVAHLGPPLIPAQETYHRMRDRVIDPTFELVYWGWGLDVANRWRTRLGLAPEPSWTHVVETLAAPTVRDGVYAAIGVAPWTGRTDHPSMLCAFGVLPSTAAIDEATMAATLDSVLGDWEWDSTWGWDYPVIAMCAARLGRPEQAVDALLRPTAKNTLLSNGHNWQEPSLPVYLPGNGGLLAAVALMAGGWDGCGPRTAPGFPPGWDVRVEGFVPLP